MMDQGLVILVRRELSGHESNVKEGTRAICLNHMSELMVVDPTNAIVTITLQFDHSTLVQELHSQFNIIYKNQIK